MTWRAPTPRPYRTVELTGDYTPDLRALLNADIIVVGRCMLNR